jgi:hypothetical protein
VHALAEGNVDVGDAGWENFAAAGVRGTIQAPLAAWTISFEDAFDLTFEAVSAPGEISAVEGAEGYEQLCRVHGKAGGVEIDGLGQRGHSWGDPDWSAVSLTRTVSAWLDDDALGGITVLTARPAAASAHADESVAGLIVEAGEPVSVFDPRLSTTYDGDGHTRRCGLELWVTEDGYPLRAAGEVICGTTMDLGALRLDVAFMRWHAEGRSGVGRYEILRRS